jgi:hypothetical protein
VQEEINATIFLMKYFKFKREREREREGKTCGFLKEKLLKF